LSVDCSRGSANSYVLKDKWWLQPGQVPQVPREPDGQQPEHAECGSGEHSITDEAHG
jgi:hypothetical protein